MKEIPLTRQGGIDTGLRAQVDDADYDELIQWRWNAKKVRAGFSACRYATVDGRKVMIYMHQQIMGCDAMITHIDRSSPLNNQRDNLCKTGERPRPVPPAEKWCPVCKLTCKADEFHLFNRSTGDGLQWACKVCQRIVRGRNRLGLDTEYRKQRQRESKQRWVENNPHKYRETLLKKKYGVSQEWYEQKFAQQDGKCWICGRPEENRFLAVDHHGPSGQVRDLLCTRHNIGIGYFGEDEDLLIAAAAYLRRHREARE